MKRIFAFLLALASVFLIPLSISAYNSPDGEYDEVTDPADIDYRFGGFGALEYIDNDYWYVCYWEDGRKELVFPYDYEVSGNFRVSYSGTKEYMSSVVYIYNNKGLSPLDPEWHIADDVIFKNRRESAIEYSYNFILMPDGYYEIYGEDGHRKVPLDNGQNPAAKPDETDENTKNEGNDFFGNLWDSIARFFESIGKFFAEMIQYITSVFVE
ncbi:MAG: hypothetical protein II702_02860 [Clostridia bacterium]|nr:hypothetical protein [Clostridia bacterium]